MLYIESKRLGRSTAIGLLSIAVIILLQGLFGAWKMEQLTDDLSKSLVVFSDTQVEALTLKGMLINLRKLEKDILLYNQSPEEEQRVLSRWQKAQLETKQQFIKMELELQESEVHEGESIAALSTAFHKYSTGISLVATQILENTEMTQYQALQAMAEYKQHIYTMEASIDDIVEAAEDQEIHTLEYVKQKKRSLFWTLGLFGIGSLILSIILSIWIVRKNMHISRTLEYQALHDALTGIYNRRGLAVIMTEQRTSGILSYLDFDRFKLVNDLCGHTVGDELLIDLTKKMKWLCRQNNCKLARVGGDEFVIWFANTDNLEQAQSVSEQLVALVENHPFEWMGQRMPLGASVGIAVAKIDFLFTELISRADAACRIAKMPGNAKVLVYEESDPSLIEIRQEERWAAKIPQMILNQRFCLYGQSIVPLQSTEATGHIEILLRGLDENGHIIPPGLFLPAAERFGLMPKIDQWVIETLLANNLEDNAHYSINMSAHTMADKAYLPKLVKLIAKSGKGQQLIFEITESAAMTSIETAQEYIRTLKAIGCRFSLDDFGSGFSSFAYLRDLQVDYLKIDGSLIKVLGRNPADAALVQAIVNMAASLNLQTIAEYVETPELAALLYDMKVDFGQGYGLHKPEPLTKLKTFMSIKYDPALNI